MKRFWSFALVACLLLALVPVTQDTATAGLDQEVTALVAGISAGQVVAITATPALGAVPYDFVEMPLLTQALEREMAASGSPHANARTAAPGTDSWRPRPSSEWGYDVLKMPTARRT